jgi:aminopeptidase N
MDFRFGNTNAKPMSSYLLMLAIGKFEKSVKNQNQNFLRNVFGKKDATKFEPTYRDSKRMFDF